MKKLLFLGKICHKYLITSTHSMSTKFVGKLNRSLKIESENKNLANNIVPSIMLNREIKLSQDWKDVKKELLNTGKITQMSIDSAILNFCMASENYELGFQYMDFLKAENIKPSLAAFGKHFKLLYLNNKDKILDASTEFKIISMYKELRQSHKIFDYVTSENVIFALSLTQEWQECLKLLEEIKISSVPSFACYSIVAATAFKNDNYDLGWKIVNQMFDENRLPQSIVYISYLNKCERESVKDFHEKIEKLFEIFQLHDVKCDTEVAKKIFSSYKRLKLNVKHTFIKKGGLCNNCKQTLLKMTFTQEEFNELKEAVFKKVIIGSNIFNKSTPDELKRFEHFIENMKKYDVVIDGLNVAYSVGTKQPTYVLSSLITTVVKHFVNEGKSVLLLGRMHMQKWSNKNWSYILQNADTFLTESLSQDDPYLLYCALNSGMNTIIVSRDLMRSHSFKLKDSRLKYLFNHWLLQHSYQLLFVNSDGKIFFKYPPQYTEMPQKLNNVWHIPYEVQNNDDVDIKWLCLNA